MANIGRMKNGLGAGLLMMLAVLLLVCGFATAPAWAQTGTAQLSGTVRDQNGGIIPGAALTLTQTDTGLVRHSQTNATGDYYFGNLPRGPYRLVVEKQGFKQWQSSMTLVVGQTATADATLTVGQTTQVVQVKAAASPINVQNGSISTVISYTAIQNLPVNGRQISNLFRLTPGVESGTAPRTNGMKVGSTAITLDGITEVDRFSGGFARQQPGYDTVQEFRYDTTGADARFASPGNVILQTRSGTNQFHGTAYEFLTDSSGGLQTRQIQDGPGVSLPPQVRNEFGANVGGPVIIPHLYNGRDKTFFFFDYEGLRNNQIASPYQSFVPTMAMWNGDLSNAVTLNGPITIYDPTSTGPAPNYTRTPFPNNQIPASEINKFAKTVQSFTALPTNSTNPFLGPNFIQNYPNDQSNEQITAKVDQNVSDRTHLSVRLTRVWSKQAQEGGYYANPPIAQEASGIGSHDTESNIYNVGVDYTQSLSNRWLNEIQAGVLRSYTHYGTLADFKNWDAILGLPNPFSATGWPSFGTGEVCCTGISCGGFLWCACNVHVQALTTEEAQDNATFVKGKHTIQFGGNVSREQNNIEENQQAQGSDYFSPSWTALYSPSDQAAVANTGSGFAEMLLGLPNYLSNQFNHGMFYFRQTNLGLYVQDRYHASQKLTLNFGLRWDYWSPYKEQGNLISEPNPNTVLTSNQILTVGNVQASSIGGVPPAVLQSWEAVGLTTATANSVGYPSALFRQIYHNFSPRIGAAYKINNKTVLRGAFGTYYFPMPLNLLLQSTRVNPPFNLRFQNEAFALNAANTFPYISAPPANWVIPATTVNTTGVCASCVGREPYEATMWEGQNWEDAKEATWNVSLERELPANIVVRASYIGTHGMDLEQPFAIDAQEPQYNYAVRTGNLPPSFAALLQQNPFWGLNSYAINNTGYSWDNSAQLQLTRRFANGLSFDWFYTYSRALSTADPSGASLPTTSINYAGSQSAGGGGLVPASYQLIGEPNLTYSQLEKLAYFNSTSIPPHRVTFDVVYMLPFGRGRHFGRNMNRALDAAIGGWEVSTISTWNSGYWMGISTSLYQFGNPRISAGQRPTLTFGGQQYRLWFKGNFDPTQATNVSGGNLTSLIPANVAQRTVRPAGPNCSGAYPGGGQLAVTLANGKCYNAPVNFYNYSPRANIIGPGAWDSDISLFKTFAFSERWKFRLEGDFFNAFNHPNEMTPNATTGLQPLFEQPNLGRQIQLSGRLTW